MSKHEKCDILREHGFVVKEDNGTPNFFRRHRPNSPHGKMRDPKERQLWKMVSRKDLTHFANDS